MSKLTKRITAMLLSGMLIFGSIPGSVFAADADAGQTSEYAEEVFTEEETAEEKSEAADAGAEMAEEEVAEASEGNVADTSEEAAVQYYTVTLDANGGYFENEWDDSTGEIVEQAEVVEKHVPVDGTVATFPVFKDLNGQTMVFAGWSLERDGELISQAEEEYIPVDNCVLYAVWQAEDAALAETGEQQVADEVTEQADAAQEMEGIDAAAGDTVTAEGSAAEEDTAAEANTDPETENEQDIVSDQQELYVDEGTENISEDSSDAVVSEEGEQPELNESSNDEEEIVRDDAANGVVESGTCGDNLTWTLNEEGTLIINGTGEMYDCHYDTRPFKDHTIVEVIVNEGVTSIGNYAFYSCSNLTNITIPESVTSIGDCAFESCSSLTNITIPSSVTSIGENAFGNCGNLASVIISEGVTSIGDFAFHDCTSLTNITIPSSVTSIGGNAFGNCGNLASVIISEGVTSIGNFAFADCTSMTFFN